MTTMLLQAENKTDLKPFAQIARKQGIIVRYIVQKETKLKSPSPSGDAWFDDPNNLAYLQKKIKSSKSDNHYIIQENESVREFFDKL